MNLIVAHLTPPIPVRGRQSISEYALPPQERSIRCVLLESVKLRVCEFQSSAEMEGETMDVRGKLDHEENKQAWEES